MVTIATNVRRASQRWGEAAAAGTERRINRAAAKGPRGRGSRRPNDRRGAAVVEFAVVASLLMMLVFGIIEYGRLVMVQQILTNAAREGSRKAVLLGVTNTDVTNVVANYLDGTTITGQSRTIEVLDSSGNSLDLSTAQPGDPVTVRVSISFADVSWLPAPMYLGSTVLSASSTMRRETAQ